MMINRTVYKCLGTLLLMSLLPLFSMAQWNIKYIPSDNQLALDVLGTDTIITVTENGGRIHRSYDGGNTWSFYQHSFNYTWYLDVHFPSKSIGYAVGGTAFGNHANVVIKSSDAGLTWDSITSNDFTGMSFHNVHFINEDTGFVSGEHGLLIRTLDGGNTFKALITPSFNQISEVFFFNDTLGFIATGTRYSSKGEIYGIYKTNDLGLNWTLVYNDTMYERDGLNHRSISKMEFVSTTTGYAVGGNGLILKTEDAGNTWTTSFIAPYSNLSGLSFTSEDEGFINNAGGVYKTINGGKSWHVQNVSPLAVIGSIKMTNDTIGYALGGGKVYKTINSGGLVGMAETRLEQTLSFYPNPAKNVVYFSNNKLSSLHVRIYALTGELLIDKQVVESLDISDLSRGVYIINSSKGDTNEVQKLIVQ